MIVVVGGGSIGLLLAAAWGTRTTVSLVVRTPEQARRINRCGVTVCGRARRTVRVRAAAAESGEAEALLRQARAVVVCVKTYQTVAALRPMRRRIPRRCPVVTVQNGLCPERAATRALGRPVYRGIVTAGAMRLSANRVRWTGRGEVVLPMTARAPAGALAGLDAAAVPVRTAADFERRLWSKFAVNCVINAIGTLAAVPNGEVWRRPALRRLGMRVLDEVVRVFSTIRACPAVGVLRRALREVCMRTASNINSTLQDVRAGARLTEIGEFNGAVVVAARRRGVAAPVNEMLAVLVAERAAGADHA